ncbi:MULTISPECIES: glycine cleavage system aminomethyltransferase GcvT [unclassified Yimella]|uniref:glycine cleavage system aminomethyltransferase GcvT n=1 Tax=unclassified Yimella TaxID=2649892 RepID=UPI00101C0E54|nr:MULTISPECIES: glycine cleavage system aminomethyltransferase GcvT [unclassified Yimella]MCG8655596.1 glycine cleavage system aminomethyltransferase GcvT [Yimella sp. NH-Cas1]RYG78958.1 glycine cleavage system aminomethyltransferase GcvT [Yimella sp. RIT 621]
MSDASLKASPLHDRHQALGAKMADFGGWQMPIEYPGGGVLREHTAVREAVGIFDVSHLGKALVKGPGAADFVNSCFTNDLRKISPPKAQYTMCCDEETGGVVDDLIQYLRSDDEVFLVPNAANTAEVVRRLNEKLPEGVTVTDQHTEYGVIAVQGPKSFEVVEALGLPTDLEYMSFAEADWNGKPVIVLRSGYTGEKGFELVPRWQDTPAVWDALVEAMEPFGGLPCGLGARDTLRTEMGYPLHGNDLSMDITPNMARSGWAVGWKKDAFWGKDVLEKQKAAKDYRLTWGLLVTGRGIPRAHCEVKDSDGKVIGEVTSGTMSPTLKQGIALALLDRDITEGTQVTIDVRGRGVEAKVVKPPFVQVETD